MASAEVVSNNKTERWRRVSVALIVPSFKIEMISSLTYEKCVAINRYKCNSDQG